MNAKDGEGKEEMVKSGQSQRAEEDGCVKGGENTQ